MCNGGAVFADDRRSCLRRRVELLAGRSRLLSNGVLSGIQLLAVLNQSQPVPQSKIEELKAKVGPFYISNHPLYAHGIGIRTETVLNIDLSFRRKRYFAQQRKSAFRNFVSAAKDRLLAPG